MLGLFEALPTLILEKICFYDFLSRWAELNSEYKSACRWRKLESFGEVYLSIESVKQAPVETCYGYGSVNPNIYNWRPLDYPSFLWNNWIGYEDIWNNDMPTQRVVAKLPRRYVYSSGNYDQVYVGNPYNLIKFQGKLKSPYCDALDF